MLNLTFGNLLTLVLTELSATLVQTTDKTHAARMRVRNVELEIPALLNLTNEPNQITAEADAGGKVQSQLIVTMPSPREVFPLGRVGRIRMTIESEKQTDAPIE